METIEQIIEDVQIVSAGPRCPDDRLTSRQVSEEFNIPDSTLRSWRMCRGYDKRFPRYHKLFTGKVFYVRCEIEEDLAGMEVETDIAMCRR